jgi:threonine aldolase
MRQVGVLAAAGLLALDRVDRLAEDHERAQRLAKAAAARWPGSVDPATVETNIVRFEHPRPLDVVGHLAEHDVLAVPGSSTVVRLVTHADVDDADVDRAIAAIEAAP